MIKVLHKALNILEYLSRYPDGQTLSAIAAHIGEKPTTTSNIVQVLAGRNYLERTDGRWKLGVSAYLLTGSAVDYDRALCSLAEPILRVLADDTEASVVLSVWRGSERYVLLRIADESAVTVNRAYPLATEVYSTATGMMLLACQPREIIDAYIEANGLPGIAEPADKAVAAFLATLALSRERGYYIREKESIFEAAAPLHEADGSVRTAVGIFLPQFRAGEREKLVGKLIEVTHTLEKAMRGSEPPQAFGANIVSC